MAMANAEYRISERISNGAIFSYCYRADGYSAAIAKWVKATFCEGCTFTEPDNHGHFQVHTPKGMTYKAIINRA